MLLTTISLITTLLQIPGAHAKSFQSAFTSRFLVTDLNNGESSFSVVTPLPAG
jgi:hypothetical protein